MQAQQKLERLIHYIQKSGAINLPSDLFDPEVEEHDPPSEKELAAERKRAEREARNNQL
jgi:hypothetical protein